MAPSTQQALLLTEQLGGFTVDKAFPVPASVPAGKVLVKVKFAGLAPIDWKRREYGFAIEGYPAVLGSDYSGEVVEVGQDVSGFKPGDRVSAPTCELE